MIRSVCSGRYLFLVCDADAKIIRLYIHVKSCELHVHVATVANVVQQFKYSMHTVSKTQHLISRYIYSNI